MGLTVLVTDLVIGCYWGLWCSTHKWIGYLWTNQSIFHRTSTCPATLALSKGPKIQDSETLDEMMTYDDPPSRARESVVNPDLAFASGETPRVLPNGCIRTCTATAATNEILLYLQCSLGMSTTCCKLRRSLSSEQWNQSTITSVVLFCFPLEPCINGQTWCGACWSTV